MALNCDPNDLVIAGKCFECLTAEQRDAVKTYLLAVLAGGSTDPATLLADAKCFLCLNREDALAIQNYLLCQLVP